MKKFRSEFYQISDHSDGHTCAFEFVPTAEKAKAIYVVFDGMRIAHRGDPDGPDCGEWVSMEPGFEVIDESPDTLAVYFEGKRLH